jgi:ferredoxin-type protein NapH
MSRAFRIRSGRRLVTLSLITRFSVVLLLCSLALLTEYVNLKMAYNHPRLVELSSGKPMRIFYEAADGFFSQFGDPMQWAQTNGGMTWSIRLMGIPFTDPVAALSVMAKDHQLRLGFALGLIAPLSLALLAGRAFCAYICPASLLFFSIARLRLWLGRWFLFPDLSLHRGFSWGILAGGLGLALWTGHGVWTLILPYFALGQTLFHGIAMGTLSIALGSLLVFAALDFFFGRQFTCRHVCPTGRLLGFIGRKSVLSIRREATACVSACNRCAEVCPMQISPKLDHTVDCSACGECMVICPTQCLSVGSAPRRIPPAALNSTNPTRTSAVNPRHDFRQRNPPPVRAEARTPGSAPVRLNPRTILLLFLLAVSSPAGRAHHFKGLPHYNYFENYPQVPEEEFLGQAGDYEFSLVVYDFQGINRDDVADPDTVRLFLLIFSLTGNRVYQGPLTLDILDRSQIIHSETHPSADLENIYSLHRSLADSGKYTLRVTLQDSEGLSCEIPFRLSAQNTHWGKWIALAMATLILIAAIGGRKARMTMDRREAHERASRTNRKAHA